MKWWPRVTLVLALLFIATATLTSGSASTSDALPSSFWCFACGQVGGADFTTNIVLFAPLGIALVLVGVRPSRAVLVGALLSGAVELAQAMGHPAHRVASINDLTTNSLGTLVGALIGLHRMALLFPTRTQARTLGVATLLFVSALLSFSAWALGLPVVVPVVVPAGVPTAVRAVVPSVVPAEREVRRSELTYTPGYGWYHGLVHDATVNGVLFAHQGDGPILLQADPQSMYQLSVRITGRDERDGFVPFVYVHGAKTPLPSLMLGQRGSAAELQVQLRGAALRLPAPVLVLPEAFPAGVDAQRSLAASVSPSVWTMAVRQGFDEGPGMIGMLEASPSTALVRGARLQISLALGWSLFQNVVQTRGAAGAAMSLLWLFVLWFPAGYWCTTAMRPAYVAGESPERSVASVHPWWRAVLAFGVLTLLLTVVLTVVPAVAGISRSPLRDWLSALGGLSAGVATSCIVTSYVVTTWRRNSVHRAG